MASSQNSDKTAGPASQPTHCAWSGETLTPAEAHRISLTIPVLLAPPKTLELSIDNSHEGELQDYVSRLNQRNLRFMIYIFVLPLALIAIPAMHVLMPENSGLLWIFAGILPLFTGLVLHEYPVPVQSYTDAKGVRGRLNRNALLGKLLMGAGLLLAVFGLVG
ncbi:hypothetical protein CYPRO_1648 [Cyclonatronum proteinivorum]|uniref:Uncharacterized protein n=1 Tax=Cyclonatronum proteinivorum TaxID=1457365 RepID=A0A345UK97_9BACT|nr:hypothetical protein [Cyclonatronum proteinivorum]AXJ00899.1 hypothetical protein CYPRO_1648 [Cyclonatronum proteinivorum]